MSRKIRHHNVPADFHAESETEALILEQALAFYREIKTVAENSPDGQVLAQAEAVCLLKGREFLRKSLELTVQEQIDELEKKNETRCCPTCQTKKRHRGYRNKDILTATGDVTFQRRYDECLPCQQAGFVADMEHHSCGVWQGT